MGLIFIRQVSLIDCSRSLKVFFLFICVHSGADLGGGGGSAYAPPPPLGFDPLPTQRVPALVVLKKSLFGRPTLNQYLPILRGERAPKNAIFWSKFFKKCLKMHFDCF